MGDAPVLLHCSLLRNPDQPTGVLEHCHEGETNCWFSIFGGRFLLTASQNRRSMSLYISLFALAIPATEIITRCLSLWEGLGWGGVGIKLAPTKV